MPRKNRIERRIFTDGTPTKYPLETYSVNDTVTPLIPGSSSGTTQFTLSSPYSDKYPLDNANKRLVLYLYDSSTETELFGAAGRVNGISFNKGSNIAGYTVDSDINLMNANITVLGSTSEFRLSRNIYNAILVTMGLEVPSIIEFPDMDFTTKLEKAYFPNTLSNALDTINSIAAASQLELVTPYGNLTASFDVLVALRRPGNNVLTISGSSATNVSLASSQRARKVSVTNYDYRWAQSQPFWKTDQVYQVAATEIQEIRVQTNATPLTLIQPSCVLTMIPETGPDPVSAYVVTGADGYIVDPQFWIDNGGKITVKINDENPSELIITIYGADNINRGPYRISEGEADRPALRIGGTGVVSNPHIVDIYTADQDTAEEVVTLDNPMIGSLEQVYAAGIPFAAQYGQPTVTLNGTAHELKITGRGYTTFTASNNLLSEQVASGGKRLNSVKGFSSDFGPVLTSLGVQATVPVNTPAGKIMFTTDTSNINETYRQSSYIVDGALIPDRRKSIQRLCFTEVVAGTHYSAAFMVRRISALAGGINTLVRWYDVNMTYLSQNSIGWSASTLNTDTQRNLTNITAPSNAAYAELVITNSSTSGCAYILRAAGLFAATAVPAGALTGVVIASSDVTATWGKMSMVPGSLIEENDAIYRIDTATYSPDSTEFSASLYTTYNDFTAAVGDMTIDEFSTYLQDHGDPTIGQFMTHPLDYS